MHKVERMALINPNMYGGIQMTGNRLSFSALLFLHPVEQAEGGQLKCGSGTNGHTLVGTPSVYVCTKLEKKCLQSQGQKELRKIYTAVAAFHTHGSHSGMC